MSKNFIPTIMIDLDGVLNKYTKYDKFSIPDIKDGAKEFLEELHSLNYNLILFTTRNSELAKEWLIKNNIDKYFSEITNIKKPAKVYFDDRAVCFNGDYKNAVENIKNFQPYWKNNKT